MMCGILITLLFAVVDTTIRNSIDYSTSLGNCTYDAPVFASVIGESVLGCFGKFDIVRTHSYEHTKFFDINKRSWIRIRKIKSAKKWCVSQWVDVPTKTFPIYHHRIDFTPPDHGQLLYLRGHDTHILIRTFGKELEPRSTTEPIRTTTPSTTGLFSSTTGYARTTKLVPWTTEPIRTTTPSTTGSARACVECIGIGCGVTIVSVIITGCLVRQYYLRRMKVTNELIRMDSITESVSASSETSFV